MNRNRDNSMLPSVDFCGLNLTRLLIGGNPFAGFSHQNPERDAAMRGFYTVERIKETWQRAEKAGINTTVTNNENANVLQALQEYLDPRNTLQWIAQVNKRAEADMVDVVADVVATGCKAIYFHGGLIDQAYAQKTADTLREWCDIVHSHGIPVGAAGHSPDAHRWVNSLNVVDFHAVCCFNCGSLHDGKGDRFQLGDLFAAMQCIREIGKPCIAYKIMGAGRIDPRMAFECAFEHIKPGDVVNVGMYRGDSDTMVEENAAMVRTILSDEATASNPA